MSRPKNSSSRGGETQIKATAGKDFLTSAVARTERTTKSEARRQTAMLRDKSLAHVLASGGVESQSLVTSTATSPLISFRPYQRAIFLDRESGVQLLHWSRQIGKSFTLAAWAIDRLLTRPGRLVTVLSNSRDNGGEFAKKCAEVCELMGRAFESEDQSPDISFENMRFEIRVTVNGKTGRIKVLASNPRTARGFSGDLILDEFAFHENSNAIWEAAEPILSSNPDFLCRIASTGNGKHNMFYRMTSTTSNGFSLSRIPRSEAYRLGVKIYNPTTRKPITPEAARALSMDKKAYDQNYECLFNDENSILLTHELISAAEENGVGLICSQDWTHDALQMVRKATGHIYIGVDVARNRDFTVISCVESLGQMRLVRAILRIENMRFPDQRKRLNVVCAMPQFRGATIDMTAMGVGLTEETQEIFGQSRIRGINFASTVPLTKRLALEGRTQEKVRVTEALATELLHVYEDRRIKHPCDEILREDLRKPERITSPGGRVSIAATRDEAGHADHFWSFALAIDAATAHGGPFAYEAVEPTRFEQQRIERIRGVLV